MESSNITPLVSVLLCSYQGERFLLKQLSSITSQDIDNLAIHISDDGSTDNTVKILKRFKSEYESVAIYAGPKKGFASNFLSLISRPDVKGDYFAFSDQDDIWAPDKLSRAITMLEKVPTEKPALYCARTKLIDEHNNNIGFSPIFKSPPSFQNALVQSIGGGNTMVMNKAARELLKNAGEPTIVSHDWWAYQLVSGAGGNIFYDTHPSVLYRQHSSNLIGSNSGWSARLERIGMLLKGRFRDWNTINCNALMQTSHLLTEKNRQRLGQYHAMRNAPLLKRLRLYYKLRLYRQTRLGNIGLLIATLLGKL